MKRIPGVLVTVILALSLIMIGCTKPAPAPSSATAPAPAATPAPKPAAAAEKIKISCAGQPVGFAWYPAAVALNNFINKNTKLDITTTSTAGPLAVVQTVVQKLADIGLPGFSAYGSNAYFGWWDFEGKPNKGARNLINLGTLYSTFATTPRSGIKKAADLKSKRVAEYTAQPNYSYDAIIKAHGVDPVNDVKRIKLPSINEALPEITLGRLDAAGGAVIASNVHLELQEAAGGIVFIEVDPDKMWQYKKQDPKALAGFSPGVYMPQIYPQLKVEKPVQVLTQASTVFCLDTLSEEAAYLYVKTILENVDQITPLNPTLKPVSLKGAVPILDIPYHPGAIRAFKEKGLWTAELEQNQQQVLK